MGSRIRKRPVCPRFQSGNVPSVPGFPTDANSVAFARAFKKTGAQTVDNPWFPVAVVAASAVPGVALQAYPVVVWIAANNPEAVIFANDAVAGGIPGAVPLTAGGAFGNFGSAVISATLNGGAPW